MAELLPLTYCHRQRRHYIRPRSPSANPGEGHARSQRPRHGRVANPDEALFRDLEDIR